MGRLGIVLWVSAAFLYSCGSGDEGNYASDAAISPTVITIPDSLPVYSSMPEPQSLPGYAWTKGTKTVTQTECDSLCSTITWDWFTLTQAPSQALIDSVSYFNWYYITAIPGAKESHLDSIAHAFFKEAANGNAQVEFPTAWEENNGVVPIAATQKTFSVQGYVGGFYGGAHPIYATYAENFNALTGQSLKLADVVANTQQVTAIGQEIFRKQKGVNPSTGWEEAGFTFPNGMFYLPEAFVVLPEGLLFLYTVYEISSYVEGEHFLFIPYSLIAEHLAPEYQYLSQQ